MRNWSQHNEEIPKSEGQDEIDNNFQISTSITTIYIYIYIYIYRERERERERFKICVQNIYTWPPSLKKIRNAPIKCAQLVPNVSKFCPIGPYGDF